MYISSPSGLAPGANASTPLWQLQLCGKNKGAFAFRLLTVVKDALLQHPNADVRALRDLETVLQLRLIVGSRRRLGHLIQTASASWIGRWPSTAAT